MIDALLGSTLLSGLLVSLRVQPSVILPLSVPGLAHQLSPNALGQTLTGTVVGYGEADENEWLIQTATGVVVADAGSREDQVIHIPVGEAVTLTGEWDDGEFDVITITRADGTQIFIDSDS